MGDAPQIVGRIYGNLGKLLGGKAVAGALSLAYLAIAARALGPADFGVLVLVHTYVLTVGGIVEFPGWHAVVRYGAQALATDDRFRLSRLLGFAAVLELAAGALAVVTAAVLAPWLGPRLGWSDVAVDFAAPYSLAVLASIRGTPAGYLQLTGRFDLLGAHNMVAPLVRIAGATISAFSGMGLKGFLIAWLAAALAEWVSMWALGLYAARGQVAWGQLAAGVREAPRENAGLWRFLLAANADVTASEFAARATPLAVGWMLGPASAGLYAVAQRATVLLAQPAQIFGQAAYAELARLAVTEDRGRRMRAVLAPAIGMGLGAAVLVCAVVALFGRSLAVLLAGEAFAGAAGVMLALTIGRGLLVAAPPMSAALTALGRPGLSMQANLIAGLGLLAVLPPLLRNTGLAGAGALAVAQALTAVGLLFVHLMRQTGTTPPVPGQASA